MGRWRRQLLLVPLLVLATLAPAGAVHHLRKPPKGVEMGLASYYGPGFNGNRTASGEFFDQRKLVAAHRTLPLGSVVRVTNRKNGRSVVLRIVDRGPYGPNHRKGCIIDVSKAAARRLEFVHDGIVHVTVRVLHRGDGSPVAGPVSSKW